ncbi:MAG: hypothetical protein ACR2Q4_22125 [Geminicoccaceae bacterium]
MPLSLARKKAVWSALGSLATFPIEQRTLTLLASLIQDRECRAALAPYIQDGPYGAILDACRGTGLGDAVWQCFEMEALTGLPGAVVPTLLASFQTAVTNIDAYLYLKLTESRKTPTTNFAKICNSRRRRVGSRHDER